MENTWQPITEDSLWDLINAAEWRMTPDVARFWEVIRIHPVKWRQQPWGDSGGGFWVVGVIGSTVIWFNDIEDGFNVSSHSGFEEILDYACSQDDLEVALVQLLHLVRTGAPIVGRASPPIAGRYPGG
jgi:hypothetical protein